MEGIYTAKSLTDKMLHTYHNGKERGTTTYVDRVDAHWTWRPTEVTMWTGYQNEGKSLYLEQLSTLKSAMEGWPHAVFSPENMPAEDYFDNIIEMYIGKSCDKHYAGNLMTEAEYLRGIEFVDKYFYIIYPDSDFKLETIQDRTDQLIKDKKVKNLILDPYNTIDHEMRVGEREDLYISRFMANLKRYAVKNYIPIQLVAHQLTPQKDEQGRYVKPDVNKIKGGGTFADKADNVNFVWRPNRALDFSDTAVVFGSQKIKKQKLVGIPGEVEGINFSRKQNRYSVNGTSMFHKLENPTQQNNLNGFANNDDF